MQQLARNSVPVAAALALFSLFFLAGDPPPAAAYRGACVRTHALEAYGQRPLAFEPNHGQADPRVSFVARGDGYAVLLAGAETRLALRGAAAAGAKAEIGIRLVGAAQAPLATALEPLPGRSHYLIGGQAQDWKVNVPQYARVRCHQVYPGIDVDFYGNQRRLEYDFVVAPGADPSMIHLTFEGVSALRIDPEGDLVLATPAGPVRQHKPIVLQEVPGGQQELEGHYVLKGTREAGFQVAHWDRAHALRIDPILSYSTYLGGDGAISGGNDYGRAIATDGAGYIYVAGQTESSTFPTTQAAMQPVNGGSTDAFVAKLSPDGRTLVYSTYLGGNSTESVNGLAVDPAGNAFVTGITDSSKFPVTAGALQPASGGSRDVFVAKLNPSGGLVYSTYLGGNDVDEASSIAVTAAGEAIVAGWTSSRNFPTTAGAVQGGPRILPDAFVSKLNTAGTALVFSTYLGGSFWERANAVTVDSTGNAYVAGYTNSPDFPVSTDAPRRTPLNQDGFVAKFSAAGALLFSVLVGGDSQDAINAVAVDPAGEIFLTGETLSPDFPVTKTAPTQAYGGGPLDGVRFLQNLLGALRFWQNHPTSYDAFFLKLNSAGTTVLSGMFLGGSGLDSGRGIALDEAGDVFIAGETESRDFPVSSNAVQRSFGGGSADAFLLKLNGKDLSVGFLTYIGGDGEDRASALAVDAAGNAYITGWSGSTNLPTTAGSLQPARAGGADAFVTKLDPTGSMVLAGTYLGGGGASPDEQALGVAVDREGNAYITGRTMSANFPVTDGAFQTEYSGGTSSDAFVTKIDPTGRNLVYSTYLGGSREDIGYAVAVDLSGSAYVTGTTNSADFPLSLDAVKKTLTGLPGTFVTKLSPDGAGLVYSTFIDGSSYTAAAGIAVDVSGNAYVAGSTKAKDFPTTPGAFQKTFGSGDRHVFLSKLNAGGTALVYSTFLGGSGIDDGYGIAVDSAGSAYVAGATNSQDFPTSAGAFQRVFGGGPGDGFVAKFDPAGALAYSTYLGGSAWDELRGVAVDSSGAAYVTGWTASDNFPATAGAAGSGLKGRRSIAAKLDPAGGSLAYSASLASSADEYGAGIAVDSSGSAYVTGLTASRAFPVTDDAPQVTLRGRTDAFAAKLDQQGKTILFGGYLGGTGDDRGAAIAVDAQGNAYVVGQGAAPDFPTTAGAAQPAAAGPRNGFAAKIDFSQSGNTTRPLITKVANYASGSLILAPGSIIVITGERLASASAEAGQPLDQRSTRLPLTLSGVRVTSGSNSLPLFSVSPDKIVAQLSYGVRPGPGADLTVIADGQTSRTYFAEVRSASLGIFGIYSTDMKPISSANMVRAGDNIIALVTGAGRSAPDISSGVPAPDTPAYPIREIPTANRTQTGNAGGCTIGSFVLAPGLVGVARLQCQIPLESATTNSEWDFYLSSFGVDSNKVKLYILLPVQ